jgi:hypothetical protein
VSAWHVLAEREPYAELGVDHFTRRADPEAHARRLSARSRRSASTSPPSHTRLTRCPHSPLLGREPDACVRTGFRVRDTSVHVAQRLGFALRPG